MVRPYLTGQEGKTPKEEEKPVRGRTKSSKGIFVHIEVKEENGHLPLVGGTWDLLRGPRNNFVW